MVYFISVVIPIYNVEKYIERCVRSLFEQTLQNVEYIFVDDSSLDRSVEIVKQILNEYVDRQSHVHFVEHPQNRGLPAARNSGVSKAKGDYIFHCDSDDWLEKDALYELYA